MKADSMKKNKVYTKILTKCALFVWNQIFCFLFTQGISTQHIKRIFKISNRINNVKSASRNLALLSQEDKDSSLFCVTDKSAKHLKLLFRIIRSLELKRVRIVYYNANKFSYSFDFLTSTQIVEPIYMFLQALQNNGVEVVYRDDEKNIIDIFKDLSPSRYWPTPATKDSNRTANIREFNEGRVALTSFPTSIYVELTRNCNCACTMCTGRPDRSGPDLDMELDLFKKTADTLFPYADYVGLNGFGESTISKNFEKSVDYALRFDCPLYIVTNLTIKNDYLWEKLVKEDFQIGVSFDGATEKTFELIRKGANFNTVVNNLDFLVKCVNKHQKNFGNIYLLVCVQGYNIEELPQIIALAGKIGIKKVMFSPSILPEKDPNNLLYYQDTIYGKVKESLGSAKKFNMEISILASLGNESLDRELGLKPFNRCTHPWSYVHITYDGQVTPCNHLSPNPIGFGNLREKEFAGIWNNTAYQLFRRSINTPHMHHWCDWCHKKRFSF